MKLEQKYTRKSELEEGKEVIGDDAYAICEFIEKLINQIEKTRTSLR